MTVATARMVKVIVTPRTAAGSACPERTIAASVGYPVVVRLSNNPRLVVKLQVPASIQAALGVIVFTQGVEAPAWKRCRSLTEIQGVIVKAYNRVDVKQPACASLQARCKSVGHKWADAPSLPLAYHHDHQ